MTGDRIWKILDGIQGQIRAFDTKAQITIGIDGVMAGFLAGQVMKVGDLWQRSTTPLAIYFCLGIQVAALFSIIVSIAFAVLTIHPRLKLRQPRSRTFFAHVAQEFEDDYALAAEAYTQMADEALDKQVATQILANSRICSRKAYLFKFALFFTAVSVLLWVSSLPFCFYVMTHAR